MGNVLTYVGNNGGHKYHHIQQESKNQLPLFSETQQIMIPLTNCNAIVIQFDKSYITLRGKVKFKVDVEFLSSISSTPPI